MTFVNAGDIAEVAVVERWQWWQAALKDPSKIGTGDLLIHPGEYQLGYYRVRTKEGQWEPVGIYPDDDGVVHGYRSGREAREIVDLFLWCCRNPISYDAYVKALDGGGFDDEPARSTGIGHNSADADPHDALRIEYLGEKEQIEEFLKKPVKTQADADKMAIWKDRLSKIKSKAEALHKVEKQPFLDGGRAVDAKWRELKEEPVDVIEKMRLHVKPFFDALKRAEEERQRKAREEADRIRREAEEAAARARAVDDSQNAVQREASRQAAEEAAARAREAEREAEARKVTAGRTGARMGLRKQTVGVVTDYAAAAAALVEMRHGELLETIDRLAQRAAKAGMPFKGMEVREEDVVR
jgi:hypothetical protein